MENTGPGSPGYVQEPQRTAASFFDTGNASGKEERQEKPEKQQVQQGNLVSLKQNIENTITNIRGKYELDKLAANQPQPTEALTEAYNLIDSLQKDIILYLRTKMSQTSNASKSELDAFKRIFAKSVAGFEAIKKELTGEQ